jgi:RHS repeat-associated protein
LKGLLEKYGEYGLTNTIYELMPGAIPYVTYTIDNPDFVISSGIPGFHKRLRITESRPGEEDVTDIYTWLEDAQTWQLSKANNTAVYEEKTFEDGSGDVVTVKTIMDGSGKVGEKVETVTRKFSWGDEIVRSTLDPGGENLVTHTTFYENKADPDYGQLHARINPDNSWIRYTYDSAGRKKQYISSYLDSGSSSSSDQAHTINYDYTLVDSQDSNLKKDKDNPRTITESILGTVISKTFYSYRELANGERVVIQEQCASPTCFFGVADNLTTTTTLYENGRVKSVITPDGQKTSYTYNDTGEEILNGTVTAEEGIALKTTKEIITKDRYNNVKRRETHVYTGNGYELTEWSQNDLDDLGRVEKTSYSNGTMIEPASSSCCSTIKTSSDSTGVVTSYFYDGLNRLEKTEREGPKGIITTTYVYDAAGRQVEQKQESGDLFQLTKTTFNPAGRIESTTDAAGLVTRYDYSADGLMTTVTRPGYATEITSIYPDGRVKSVTGTAVIPSYYEYGVNPDGGQWTIERSGGLDSPRYQKTTTDILGRVIETEQPGYGGTIVTKNFYNEKGQLSRTTTTGQADQLYEYDELGNQIASGLDIDDNGRLERASSDRISETLNYYKKYDGSWYRESALYTYSEEGSADSTLVSVNRSQISGLGFAAFSISEDIHGNKTISKTVIDLNSQTVTQIIDYPDSGMDATAVSVGGYLMSSTSKTGLTVSFDYDGLGRRISTTDPRTGTSVVHYNDKGRVDYVEDTAEKRSEFGYDQETGRKIWEKNALGKYTRYKYNDQGLVTGVWGEATYPVSYGYDAYGQRTHMYTYKDGSGWSSETWSADIGSASATIWHYDDETGLLSAKEDAEGKQVLYSYTQTGQLQTRTWARQDGSGPLTTTYSYDPNTAELKTIDYSDTTTDISFTYDRLGRQETVTDAVGTRTFGYTETLQLGSETISGLFDKTITRNYATSGVPGRPIGFTIGTEYSVTYGYDPATGRFNSISWDANKVAGNVHYGYLTDSDLLENVNFSSGQVVTYGYEPNRNLKTQVKNAFNSNMVSQYDYTYDALGRRKNVKNSGSAFAAKGFSIYGYNDRNELTTANRYLGSDINDTSQPVEIEKRSYGYDNIGNRNQATGWDVAQNVQVQLTYTANQLNQYSLISGDNGQPDQTPSYDVDGNMTGYGDKVYSYNTENRLIVVEPEVPRDGDTKVVNVYDYMGRRVQKKVYSYDGGSADWSLTSIDSYLYDGWNMIEELNTAGEAFAAYIWGLDLSQSLQGAGGVGGLLARVAGGASYTYALDGNGNVGQLIDGAGGISAHYEYDAYGSTARAIGTLSGINPYRFSTKYFDRETNLYYYGYRFYSPELGRWVSRDPIGEDGGVNLYGFVGNDGVNYFDPYGLSTWDDVKRFSRKTGWYLYGSATDTANLVNQGIIFPLADLLRVPDQILDCLFGITEDDLLAFSAQFPGGYDDVMVGAVITGKNAGKAIRTLSGYIPESSGKLVSTDMIRFTQDTAGKNIQGVSSFKDGRPIQSLIDKLEKAGSWPDDVAPIRVFKQDGLIYTLDNRRLLAAQKAGIEVKIIPATAKEIADESFKFTNPGDGWYIGVKGELK